MSNNQSDSQWRVSATSRLQFAVSMERVTREHLYQTSKAARREWRDKHVNKFMLISIAWGIFTMYLGIVNVGQYSLHLAAGLAPIFFIGGGFTVLPMLLHGTPWVRFRVLPRLSSKFLPYPSSDCSSPTDC